MIEFKFKFLPYNYSIFIHFNKGIKKILDIEMNESIQYLLQEMLRD